MITQYKVLKIWFVDADNKDAALRDKRIFDGTPDFVSVNDKFKVGKDKL